MRVSHWLHARKSGRSLAVVGILANYRSYFTFLAIFPSLEINRAVSHSILHKSWRVLATRRDAGLDSNG